MIWVFFQISFLVGLTAMGEIRTLFAAEVCLAIYKRQGQKVGQSYNFMQSDENAC
jgi:hypothetical protein